MNKTKISSIGEVLLYLIEKNESNYEKAFDSNEANALSMIKSRKCQKEFITIIPKNRFGEEVISYLGSLDIDKINYQRKDGRQGIIFDFKERGIILDRKYSAFYFASAMDFDFINMLDESYSFHLSMDSFSISIDSYKYLVSALKLAKKKECLITLSFTSNNFFRNDEQSFIVLNQISKYVNYLFLDFNRLKNVYAFKKGLEFSKEKLLDIYKKLKVENIIIFNEEEAYFINKDDCLNLVDLGKFHNESELIARFYNKYILKEN